MPIYKLCSHHGLYIGRCNPCRQADNQRRHRKSVAHGIKDQRWQQLRRQRLQLDNYTCQLQADDRCTGRATTVHLPPHLAGNHNHATLTDLRSACLHCHGVTDGPRNRQGGGHGSPRRSIASPTPLATSRRN